MEKKGFLRVYSSLVLKPDKEVASRFASSCLVGKIIRDYPVDGSEVKWFAERLWKCKKDFSVSEIKPNVFVFCFQEKQDWINVLLDSPWNIKGGLLILSMWTPGKTLEELDLTSSPFWVQIHGLPVDYLTEETAVKIGKILGKFICLDSTGFDDGKFLWRNFLRIRVILDVRRPLLTGHWISRTDFKDLKDIWVEFKYEKLGMFCFKCGRIGNRYRTCKFPELKSKFGPWLSVPPCTDASAALRSFAIDSFSGDGGGKAVEEANPCAPLICVPRKEIYEEEEDVEQMESLPRQIYPAAEEDSTRNSKQRLIVNTIDSMVMIVNCWISYGRVSAAKANDINWWFVAVMVAYFLYMVSKLIGVIQTSWLLKACKGEEAPLPQEQGQDYNNPKALKDILILVSFFVLLNFV